MSSDTDQKLVRTKVCTRCKISKPVSDFFKNAKGKFGVRSVCKECQAKKDRTLRATEPERMRSYGKKYKASNKEKVSESGKEYYQRNKTRAKATRADRYQKNKEYELARNRLWALSNPEKVLEIGRRVDARRRSTPRGKLDNAISAGVHRGITKGSKSGRHTFSILGYSLDDLIRHIERQFHSGMTWENYGQWHIDHIIPLAAHNYETPDDIDFKHAWSLKNLQPLWGKDNMIKGAKVSGGFQPSLALAVPANDNKESNKEAKAA